MQLGKAVLASAVKHHINVMFACRNIDPKRIGRKRDIADIFSVCEHLHKTAPVSGHLNIKRALVSDPELVFASVSVFGVASGLLFAYDPQAVSVMIRITANNNEIYLFICTDPHCLDTMGVKK